MTCWCCASVVPCGPACGNPIEHARYAWTTVKSTDRHLCVECCANWRELSLSPGGVMPKRIRELPPPPGALAE